MKRSRSGARFLIGFLPFDKRKYFRYFARNGVSAADRRKNFI